MGGSLSSFPVGIPSPQNQITMSYTRHCTHDQVYKERGAMGSTGDYVCRDCHDTFGSEGAAEAAGEIARKINAEHDAKAVFAVGRPASPWFKLESEDIQSAKIDALQITGAGHGGVVSIGVKSNSSEAIAGYLQICEHDRVTGWTQLRQWNP